MGKKMTNGCIGIGDTDMYYVSFGNGDKKLVVLPGLSDGLATVKGKALLIRPPYRKFLKDYTVYMFSRKNALPEGYTIRDMAADQVTAMKKLGIDKAYILGVSQGGMIAQYIAIDEPEIVKGLILAVTAPYANDVSIPAVKGWIEMAERGDHRLLMTDTAEKMYSDAYMKKYGKIFPLLACFTRPKSYERFLISAKAIPGFDSRSELYKISCPVFVISGDDDRTVGNDAPGEFKEMIPDCKVHIYNGYGHGIFEECSDFYDRILEFCNSIS